MMIPFIGPILATIPPVAIVLLVHPDQAWWVFLALLLLAQAVVNVLAPKVMSTSIGMHPMLVLAALLVGAKLAGLWGAIFAVPVAAVVVAMVFFYRMTVEERKIDKEERAEEVIRSSGADTAPEEQLVANEQSQVPGGAPGTPPRSALVGTTETEC